MDIIIITISIAGSLLDAVEGQMPLALPLRVLSDHFSPARLTNEAAKRRVFRRVARGS